MDIEKLKEFIAKHEGKSNLLYEDSLGYATIGIGRCLDKKGLSDDEVFYLFNNDINEVLTDLRKIFKDFDNLPESVRLALADMRFNLGRNGFRQFKKMIEAIKEKNFERAAVEALDSRWAKQVKNRALEDAELIRDGMMGG